MEYKYIQPPWVAWQIQWLVSQQFGIYNHCAEEQTTKVGETFPKHVFQDIPTVSDQW